MKRRFIRPLFDFVDPFFMPKFFEPAWRFNVRRIPIDTTHEAKLLKSNDPQDVFDRFFS